MNILLVNPTEGHHFMSPKEKILENPRFPPLGLLYVAKSLLDDGHKVNVLELFAEKNPIEKLTKSLNSADAVGISTNSYSYKETAALAKKIKEIDSSITVIIGGSHCAFLPQKSLIDVPDADISVTGDGEQTIKGIVKALNGQGKMSDIPGIHYRAGDNIEKGKPPEFIDDLDTIPFPARHLVEKYNYGMIGDFYFFRPKVTSMATTRGCPFRCKFCSRNDYLKAFRQRSADNVVEEIMEINNKYGTVIITDENFLSDIGRAHKIFDRLIQQGSDIDLVIEGTRVDTAEEGLYKKMKKAGVKFISYGLESGNQDVLDYYNKNITLAQIRKAVKLANQMNFTCMGNFILGAPIETKKHIEKTIKFACSLQLDLAIFHPLTYTYGSEMWDEAVKNNKISETDGYFVDSELKRNLGNFSTDELMMHCKNATRRFFYRPRYIIRQILKTIRTQDFRLLRIQLHSM